MIQSKPQVSDGRVQTFSAPEIVAAVEHAAELKKPELLGAVFEFIKDKKIGDLIPMRFQAQKFLDEGLSGGATALVKLAQQHDHDGRIIGAVQARAWKELAYYASDIGMVEAKDAIENAISSYKEQYRTSPETRIRSGINLIGLVTLARQLDITSPQGIDIIRMATSILEDLNKTPQAARDSQFHASRAEAFVALDQFDSAEVELGKVVQDPRTSLESLTAVTRQLRHLWKVGEKSEQGTGIIQSLGAAILLRDFDEVRLPAEDLRLLAEKSAPPDRQLEAILGGKGPQTFRWVMLGAQRAQSVGVIRNPLQRFGTGFLVRGGDIKPSLGDELCVLTNSHVISNESGDGGVSPNKAEIVFEGANKDTGYRFEEVLLSSRKEKLDATLLRFKGEAPKLNPLPFAENLPLADGTQHVYVIGYPEGGELCFSLQNNELIDHEGPDNGTPPDPEVCRVHYKAPTEHGSSGSPVCNEEDWSVIALHHAGDPKSMKRLNGREGGWPANEGIWIQSICALGHS